MTESSKGKLCGLRVLVPRPSPQGDELVSRIQGCGAEAVHFPVIEIHPPHSFSELDDSLSRLDSFDLVVLVSPSAAGAFADRLDRLDIAIPAALIVAAMGPKTSQHLGKSGIRVDVESSTRIDSEGLVQALERLDLADGKICIFRGQDGREDLKTALESRGSSVEYSACYQRVVTRRPFDPVLERWNMAGFDAVVVTSASILDALVFLLGTENRHLLLRTPVVTISDRLKKRCLETGIETVMVCEPVTDSMIGALKTVVQR